MLDSLAVAENEGQFPQKEKMSVAARIGWALLIAATLYVCYFSHLGAIGFVGPDEPRYAWVAREMVESGDWVTPRLYGKPWFEKPPLYYWSAAICFKLFGVSEASARLPSAVSALLATLALAWLAWRIYGAETAGWFLLLLPTTVGMIGFSHAAATDMPFSGMLTIAMVAAAVVLRLTLPRSSDAPLPSAPQPPSTSPFGAPWLAPIAFGAFLGAAALAKGPAALILAGGTVFFWALFTKRWRDAFRLLHPAAIASFCATALPWYILCARRNPDFLRIFLLEHNFQRFLTPEFRHEQPFWFFLPVLLVGLLPWSVFLLAKAPQVWDVPRRKVRLPSSAIFLWGWALFPMLFFSLSRSKLPGYVLPSVPPTLLILADAVATARRDKTTGRRWSFFGLGLFLLAMGIVWASVDTRVPSGEGILPAPWQSQISLWLVAGGLFVAAFGFWRKYSAAILTCMLVVLLVAQTIGGALPFLDPLYSARTALTNARMRYPDFSEQESSVYLLRRGLHYGLNFYAHREMREWSPSDTSSRWVFTNWKDTASLERFGLACFKEYLVFPAMTSCTAYPPSTASQTGHQH